MDSISLERLTQLGALVEPGLYAVESSDLRDTVPGFPERFELVGAEQTIEMVRVNFRRDLRWDNSNVKIGRWVSPDGELQAQDYTGAGGQFTVRIFND